MPDKLLKPYIFLPRSLLKADSPLPLYPGEKEHISRAFLSLKPDDLQSLIDDGHAEVVCKFCNEKYQFNKVELEAIRAQAAK